MEIWEYVIIVLIGFLGLFAGLILAFVAKEELKPGKKYILYFQQVLPVLAALCTGIFMKGVLVGIVGIVYVFCIFVFARKYFEKAMYLLFAVFFILGGFIPILGGILASITFLFGYTVASLYYLDREGTKHKNWNLFPKLAEKLIVKYIFFVIIAVAGFLLKIVLFS